MTISKELLDELLKGCERPEVIRIRDVSQLPSPFSTRAHGPQKRFGNGTDPVYVGFGSGCAPASTITARRHTRARS